MELNKKNIKRIMLLIAFAALLYWGLNNLKWISGVLSGLVSLLSPLMIGICIAFVLNLMMAGLERLWGHALSKWNSPWNARLKRPVCLTLTVVLFFGIIFAIIFILIPRLEEAGSTLVANIPTYVNQIQVWWTNLSGFAAEHGVTLPELSLSADQVKDTLTSFLQEKGGTVVNTTLNITTSIVGALVNFLLALVFSLYLLAQKETLLAQSKRLLRRALPLAKAFVVITPPSARALDENELASWLNAQGVPAIPAADTDDGVRRVLAMAGENDAICSWGSLYFTGEVRRALSAQ